MKNPQDSSINGFTIFFLLALAFVLSVPFYFWYSYGRSDYGLMVNGLNTEAIVTARGPVEYEGLPPFSEFNMPKTFTLLFKTQDGKAHTLTEKMYKDANPKEYDRPLPFSVPVTYNKYHPEISTISRYIPKNYTQLLLSWSGYIFSELLTICFAIIVLRKGYHDFESAYPF